MGSERGGKKRWRRRKKREERGWGIKEERNSRSREGEREEGM